MTCPAGAFAHTRGGEAAGFFAGLSHPVSGLDHVLAMIAVGPLGRAARPSRGLAAAGHVPHGDGSGRHAGPRRACSCPAIEIGIALSAIGLGAAVLFQARPKLGIAAALVGFFAIFHGHAHGTELPPGANGVLYSIGFVIATGLLHATGIGIGLIHRWPAGRTILRLAGALVALAGLAFLWRAVAG